VREVENGVLKIAPPKAAQPKSRRVDVAVR
jgi:hypothetical protein